MALDPDAPGVVLYARVQDAPRPREGPSPPDTKSK